MSRADVVVGLRRLLQDAEEGKIDTLTIVKNSKEVIHLAEIQYTLAQQAADTTFDCTYAIAKLMKAALK